MSLALRPGTGALPKILTRQTKRSFVSARNGSGVLNAVMRWKCRVPAMRRINLRHGENDGDKIFAIYLNTTFSLR